MTENNDNSEKLQALLVAYLDGELTASVRQDVERRLADDAEFRNQLSALQKSWDLLDCLPRSSEDKTLTQTTIAMVVAEQQSETPASTRHTAQMIPWHWVSPALALIVGFIAVALPIHMLRNQHLRDLPVAANIDLYRYVDAVEFLQRLDAEGFFAEERQDAQ